MAEQVPFKHVVGGSNPSGLTFFAGSSNGRTGVFGTSNLGSNPGPAAKQGTPVAEMPRKA